VKVLVSVDIEGVAGVTHSEQTRSGNGEYERARAWMTAEANAAIRGAFDGGATHVLVNDSHGSFRNLLLDQLDERAEMVTGKPRYLGMMAGVEQECDTVFMVGYHARSQEAGVLAHTINSFAFRRVVVNGAELGEAGLYGALAGEYGASVALLTGDDIFLSETMHLFPGAMSVQTKRAHGNASCTSLSPGHACTLIHEAAAAAIAKVPELKPLVLSSAPFTCELTTQSPGQADLFCQWPTVTRVSGSSLRFEADTMYEVLRILNSFSAMSFMLR
jgi:D-amino peptidase